MKKLNAGLLSLLLGLSICISGCGKTSGDNAQKDASAQGENQSITLLNIKGEIQSQVESLASAYEAETGVKVNVLGVSAGVDAQATLKGYYLSDQMPDIIACEVASFANWEGLLVDMSDQNWAGRTDAAYIDPTYGTLGFPYTTEAIGLAYNADILAKAGVDPWWHYVMLGRKEGRDNAVIRELDFLSCPFEKRKKSFLLISAFGTGDGVSIWRIQFLKEFLEKHLAVHADIEYRRALSPMFIKRIQECRCVIFSRPENDLYFEAIYRYCHRNHVKFVVDVDDLLLPGLGAFELGSMKSKLLTLSAKDIDDRYTMSKVNQCLPFAAADGLICSTRKLAVLYSEHLKSAAHIHPNLVSRSIFDEIPGKISSLAESGEPKFKRSNDFRLSLLIADGSKTHLYDLSTVILELLSFLKSHQDVQLTLLGLNLDNSRFLKKALGRQLRVIPRVSYDEMLYIYSINDLLIVPLDLNIFNECKSNIKFIEAATVRKPCLVRDIYEFSKDITDGKNGLLYSDSPGFIQKLEWAYENAGLLQDLGNAANRYVSRNLTTDCLDQADTDFFASLLKE